MVLLDAQKQQRRKNFIRRTHIRRSKACKHNRLTTRTLGTNPTRMCIKKKIKTRKKAAFRHGNSRFPAGIMPAFHA